MDTNQIILAVVCAVLVVFSLTVALLVPRQNPDFPGRRLPAFFALSLVLVAGMLTTVVVLGGEQTTGEATVTAPTQTGGGPATSGGAPTGTAPSSTTQALPGNPSAGKQVFNSQGCSACHTLAAAGSSGTVGPNLDKQVGSDAQSAGQPPPAFVRQSILTPNAYIAHGYPAGVMPQNFGQTLTKTQLDDVIALIVQTTH